MKRRRDAGQSDLTTSAQTYKALAESRPLVEDIELLLQLLALAFVVFRFARDALDLLVGHAEDVLGQQDAGESGDELRFDQLDSDVVEEALEGYLWVRSVVPGGNDDRGKPVRTL